MRIRDWRSDVCSSDLSVRCCLESGGGETRLKGSARPPLHREVPQVGADAGTDEAGMMQPFHLSGRSWKGRASALYFERAPNFKAKITAPTVSLQRSACGRISTEKFAMQLISSIDSTKAPLLTSDKLASLWVSIVDRKRVVLGT